MPDDMRPTQDPASETRPTATAPPPPATEVAALRALVARLDQVTATVDPRHRPLGHLDESNDAETLRGALLSRARSCLITLLQQGGPDDLREAAITIGESLQGRAPHTDPQTLWARLDELAQLPSTAASRLGPSAVEQTLRGWNGKCQQVIDELATYPGGELSRSDVTQALADAGMAIGDTSALSKILSELDGAGLIRRWKDGRSTTVAITALGREHARPSSGLAAAGTPAPGTAPVAPAARYADFNKRYAPRRTSPGPVARPGSQWSGVGRLAGDPQAEAVA